jgi:hypothetical protein
MKKLTFAIMAAAGLLLATTANSNAGVHVGFYLGGPAYCPPPVYASYAPYYGYGCYRPAYYAPYGGYYGYHRPYYRRYHHWH